MSIVSQRIVEDYSNGQRQRVLRMAFIDHLDKEHAARHVVTTDTDSESFLLEYVPVMEAKLAQIELRDIAGAIEGGVPLDEVNLSRQHSSESDFEDKVLETITDIERRITKDQLVVAQKADVQLAKVDI